MDTVQIVCTMDTVQIIIVSIVHTIKIISKFQIIVAPFLYSLPPSGRANQYILRLFTQFFLKMRHRVDVVDLSFDDSSDDESKSNEYGLSEGESKTMLEELCEWPAADEEVGLGLSEDKKTRTR